MGETVNLAGLPEIDLKLYRGDTADLVFEIAGADGSRPDFSGAELLMQARRKQGTGVLFALGSGSGIAGSDGQIRITFAAELLQDAEWTEALYDIEMRGKGFCRTLWRGRIELVHDITRSSV